MRTPPRMWAMSASLLLAGALAARGSGDDDGATATAVGAATSDVATEEATGAATDDSTDDTTDDSSPGQVIVKAAESDLGTILVDGDGIEDSLLGTLERSDGTTQVSYNGWPLHYRQNDAAPGDTTGEAVNGVWWVVSPEGEAIGAGQ